MIATTRRVSMPLDVGVKTAMLAITVAPLTAIFQSHLKTGFRGLEDLPGTAAWRAPSRRREINDIETANFSALFKKAFGCHSVWFKYHYKGSFSRQITGDDGETNVLSALKKIFNHNLLVMRISTIPL